jgi:hypothetical protein
MKIDKTIFHYTGFFYPERNPNFYIVHQKLKPLNHSAMRFKKNLLICYCLFLGIATQAQKDSLVLKNGDVIVGEIKSMDKGVLTIETDYSKNDFYS